MQFWRHAESNEARSETVPAPPRRGMVRWYDPSLWLSTGVQVLLSTALGQRFDYRLMEDTAGPQGIFDYSAERPERGLCFDYLADTGDGWNSTHAMAALVAQEQLTVGGEMLPRGRFLVLGGDEVYPAASKQAYTERLVRPFETALPHPSEPYSIRHPRLFAVPGNHDWYDGLVSFSRLFTRQRWIGGWRTLQKRSYFAVKLPANWWLWAVDVQLESDIDPGQREYFREIAERHLKKGDRIILASAEPDWLYQDIRDPAVESALAALEEQIIEGAGADIYVWVAGDLHHYRRHERVDDPRYQRIVSGGGGAYLASTHQPVFGPTGSASRRTVEVGKILYAQRCAFPQPATSWRLSFLNLFFLFKNWKVGLVTGPAYAAATWLRPGETIDLARFLEDPARLAWGLSLFSAAWFFARRSGRDGRDGRAFRLIGGAVHAAGHITLALFIAYSSVRLCADFGGPLPKLFGSFALNFVGGAIVGPALLGIYLLIGASLFGAHEDEAFSALRIEDFKHFLRFRIDRKGTLKIFPIAIPRVPRAGEDRAQYMLVEDPIEIHP
jgi:hypothetical protein